MSTDRDGQGKRGRGGVNDRSTIKQKRYWWTAHNMFMLFTDRSTTIKFSDRSIKKQSIRFLGYFSNTVGTSNPAKNHSIL
jgi:hypothetical protein